VSGPSFFSGQKVAEKWSKVVKAVKSDPSKNAAKPRPLRIQALRGEGLVALVAVLLGGVLLGPASARAAGPLRRAPCQLSWATAHTVASTLSRPTAPSASPRTRAARAPPTCRRARPAGETVTTGARRAKIPSHCGNTCTHGRTRAHGRHAQQRVPVRRGAPAGAPRQRARPSRATRRGALARDGRAPAPLRAWGRHCRAQLGLWRARNPATVTEVSVRAPSPPARGRGRGNREGD
jgi:hypothetical protein